MLCIDLAVIDVRQCAWPKPLIRPTIRVARGHALGVGVVTIGTDDAYCKTGGRVSGEKSG